MGNKDYKIWYVFGMGFTLINILDFIITMNYFEYEVNPLILANPMFFYIIKLVSIFIVFTWSLYHLLDFAPRTKRSSVKSPKYSPFQERILRVSDIARRPLTTRQLSQYSGISYNAAKNNLNKLSNRGLLGKKSLSNRTYWFRK